MFDGLVAILRGLGQRRRAERELDEELVFHVEMETRANVDAGLSPANARRKALADLGGIDAITEAVRDQRAIVLDRVWQDIGYATRRVSREPGFAAAAIVTIGLVVGLMTAVYSVASAVLLRPLPYADPDRLVAIWKTMPEVDFVPVPVPEFLDIQARAGSFEGVAGLSPDGHSLITPDVTEWVDAFSVTPNLFDLLGTPVIVGRTFIADENQPGREKAVVLAEGFWRRVFGGDPGIVGTHVRLAGGSPKADSDGYEVIGVVRWSVELSYRRPLRADVFVPRVFSSEDRSEQRRRLPGLLTFGRLKHGTTVRQADADVRALMATLSDEHAATSLPGGSARVVSLREELVGQTRAALLMLTFGAAVVLLIGCANVANLLLAGGARQAQEMAIRVALGCSRVRLLQQLLTEHLVLAVGGGTLGVVLATWATPALARLAPTSLPRADQIRVDPGVLVFALAVSAAAGLVFGLGPAWILARPRLAGSLKMGLGSVAPAGRRFRAGLVVVETALVLALLAGAGLIGNSVWRLAHLELGFNPAQVIAMQIMLPERLANNERVRVFESDLLARVRGLPGVVRAATSNELPFASGALTIVEIAGEDVTHPALVSAVEPQYLPLMEVPLRRGRMLRPEDRGTAGIAIVNETLARLFPQSRAIGRRLLVAGEWREVVGVVGDITELGQIVGSVIRQPGLSRLTLPAAYVPSGTSLRPFGVFLLARTALAPSEAERAVRRELRAIDPEVTIRRTSALDARVAASGESIRFLMLLTWTFAGVALALAAVGLYGLLAHFVGQRTREIGLRVALGAAPGQVRWLVAGQAVALVGSGAAIGLALALGGGRVIRSFLFEVSPLDPLTFAAALVVLLVVVSAGVYLPARRATRIDPSSALRCE